MQERMLSERHPKNRDRVRMPVAELADGLKEFCDLYLRAAMVLTVEDLPIGYLDISDEYAAYAVKLMVKYNLNNKMLRVKLTAIENGIAIEAEYPDGLPSLDPMAEIFAAARNAGLETDFRYNTIILRAKLMERDIIRLRAPHPRRFFAVLEETFFY